MELGECALAVAQEQREAGAAQIPAPEPAGLGGDGWKGVLVVIGWSTSPVVRHHRPEGVADLVELVEEIPATLDPTGDAPVAL